MLLENINKLWLETKQITLAALVHALNQMPDKSYEFPEDDRPVILWRDPFTGNYYDIIIEKMALACRLSQMTVALYGHDDFTPDFEGYINDCETEAPLLLLNAISQETLFVLSDYLPEETKLLCGYDESSKLDELQREEADCTEFIKECEDNGQVSHRAFLTVRERLAYAQGADDAEGWIETRWLNPKQVYKRI